MTLFTVSFCNSLNFLLSGGSVGGWARASFSQGLKEDPITRHTAHMHTSIYRTARWWLKHYSRRRDKLIDYRRQCLQSTRSLPVYAARIYTDGVCIFAGRLTDKSGTHASRKASFVLPTPMDASMFFCLHESLQSGACCLPPLSLQTVHIYSTLLPNLTGSSKQSKKSIGETNGG